MKIAGLYVKLNSLTSDRGKKKRKRIEKDTYIPHVESISWLRDVTFRNVSERQPDRYLSEDYIDQLFINTITSFTQYIGLGCQYSDVILTIVFRECDLREWKLKLRSTSGHNRNV